MIAPMPGDDHIREQLAAPLRSVQFRPFWFDSAGLHEPCPALPGDGACDLAVVGGGFTGLWTAILARRRMPGAEIIVLEAASCGHAASGRNGGFCAPSISHGPGNAMRRWPAEADALVRLGRANLEDLIADVHDLGIAAELERSGKLVLAEKPWQAAGLRSAAERYRGYGIDCRLLEGSALREYFDSPKYPVGLYEPNYCLLNPGRMVAELRRVALAQGIRIHENTPVSALNGADGAVTFSAPGGTVRAGRAVLATNIAPPLLSRLRRSVIPVFDYAIMTRPLADDELKAAGWTGRHGVADSGNQFHYARKTADNRILWGGFDAIYHFGSARGEELTVRPESFNRLARNFADALPSLSGVTFTHAWGGVIDTSARTTFFAGTDLGGRLAYAMGFTGQGVSASRFAAATMLDLLEGADTERTRLAMLRTAPFPFPPEPFRSLGVRWAQRDLATEDRTGKRSLYLRALDALRIGFDS